MKLDIQSALSRCGVSRKELAIMLGVTPQAVNKFVNGNPSTETLISIARALGVPVGELFSDSTGVVRGFVYIGGKVEDIRAVGDLLTLYHRYAPKDATASDKGDL
jgi:DNA-binding protein|nr:helix-turn-helix transcriptional regulator [uncultured Porphyromonas sp.]